MEENAFDLPVEIWRKIFSYLKMWELKSCLDVCVSWRSIAEVLYDAGWKKKCELLFKSSYSDAYRKSELSYENLYKTLNSWSYLQSASFEVYGSVELEEIDAAYRNPKHIKRFNFLKNGIVSYPICILLGKEKKFPLCYENTVVYYYTKTLNEKDRVTYDFNFSFYEENDDFAVFRTEDGLLRILTKTDKKLHTLGEMAKSPDYLTKFHIVGNQVFYISEEHKLCMTTVYTEEGPSTLQSDCILDKLNLRLLAISCVDKKVKLLDQMGVIYEIVDAKAELVCELPSNNNSTSEVTSLLKAHGFDWSNQDIYWELQGSIQLAKLKRATVHAYHNVIFIGTAHRILHIYCNPYHNNQVMSLWNRKSTLHIDLSEYFHIDCKKEKISVDQRRVSQIGVVEIENGHRIVLLYCQRLVTVVFTNNDNPAKRPIQGKGNINKKYKFIYRKEKNGSDSSCDYSFLDSFNYDYDSDIYGYDYDMDGSDSDMDESYSGTDRSVSEQGDLDLPD